MIGTFSVRLNTLLILEESKLKIMKLMITLTKKEAFKTPYS